MTRQQDNRRRAYWLKTLHEWHWVSSALCLLGMLLFAVTGFTLNHAGQIEAKPQVASQRAVLPQALRATLAQQAQGAADRAPLPPALHDWLRA
ncbi:MAG: PepSY-associated TM helix domain-containing protein, partial [Acidovorax sp.]|uniref:PepSY-associated TM helix domain-containing protein n=1 Tax=Acidovorax sp. TaxID=1872122 RepID=UPI0039E36B6E